MYYVRTVYRYHNTVYHEQWYSIAYTVPYSTSETTQAAVHVPQLPREVLASVVVLLDTSARCISVYRLKYINFYIYLDSLLLKSLCKTEKAPVIRFTAQQPAQQATG